jgi:hypothetical protein
MAGASNHYIVALAAALLAQVPGRHAVASDDAMLAACARVYDASACRCAVDAIASVGGEWEMSRPTQVAVISRPTVETLAAVAPAAGGSRSRFRQHDVMHVVQACMAPSGDAPAD